MPNTNEAEATLAAAANLAATVEALLDQKQLAKLIKEAKDIHAGIKKDAKLANDTQALLDQLARDKADLIKVKQEAENAEANTKNSIKTLELKEAEFKRESIAAAEELTARSKELGIREADIDAKEKQVAALEEKAKATIAEYEAKAKRVAASLKD